MEDTRTFLAHIASDGRTQTLLSHLQETASLAKGFARAFGGEAQAEMAGLLHDIGKYSEAFQRRLRGDPTRVDHSTAGAQECLRLAREIGGDRDQVGAFVIAQVCAALAIAGHHTGLPDKGSQVDGLDQGSLCARLKKTLEPYEAWREELDLRPLLDRFSSSGSGFIFNGSDAEELFLETFFWTRMLYSCLVDADFIDTEAFMEGHPRPVHKTSMDELWKCLQIYTQGWRPPRGELNIQRCQILDRCIQAGQTKEPGLFSLTVPTGGGKTVASLAFALAHARQWGLDRVIYVIPYTSIIEQTAAVFRQILGEENVLEHHSNCLFELEGEARPETIRLAKATENWDMPVIVTTAVQFFESLFSCRSAQCRKLHHIARSVVIFDEAQMMPISYLRPCVWTIAQLTKRYGVSAVLCTATQPALESLFYEFCPEQSIEELCPSETCDWDVFRRTFFHRLGKVRWDELADKLNEQHQVLCIVNTRKAAQILFERLEKPGAFHLSTLMHPKHRQQCLKEIRQRLKQGEPCRLVSTSLIEAGVDVDFPTVFRELAGLDSILQAAGRCNREGKRAVESSGVYVFEGEEKAPPLFETAIAVGRRVMSDYTDISSKEAIHAFFSQLLDLKGKDAQDQQGIIKLIKEGTWPFQTVADRFHLIDSQTQTIYIPSRENQELIEALYAQKVGKHLFRKLGRYAVSVYQKHFDSLNESGDLDVLENGVAILRNCNLYSQDTGLSLQADTGKSLFI